MKKETDDNGSFQEARMAQWRMEREDKTDPNDQS